MKELWQKYVIEEIEQSYEDKPLIVEGTALLPELMNNLGIDINRVLYMVPTKGFHVLYYSKRQFINDILRQCENPGITFENWMERDAQFANKVFNDADRLGMKVYRVDGESAIEEMVIKADEHLKLARRINYD